LFLLYFELFLASFINNLFISRYFIDVGDVAEWRNVVYNDTLNW